MALLNHKLNVAVFAPNRADSCSFYRSHGPWSATAKTHRNLNVIKTYGATVTWEEMGYLDAVFFQRPFTSDHLKLITLAKDFGRPVWVDYDDLLWAVPRDNPASKTYNNENTIKTIIRCIELADVVTVSTAELKRQLQRPLKRKDGTVAYLNRNVHVVPNAWPDHLFPFNPRPSQKPLVMWRGSPTHERDLMEFAEPILRFGQNQGQWATLFQGYNPWFLTERMPEDSTIVSELVPIEDYNKLLLEKFRPSLMMVPLHDSVFNRCKSNIAWLEGVAAGAVSVAPDWEEWRVPGVLHYRGQEQFLEMLEYGRQNLSALKPMAEEAAEYVRGGGGRLLQTQAPAHQRLRILQALTGQGEWMEGGAPAPLSPPEDEVMSLD